MTHSPEAKSRNILYIVSLMVKLRILERNMYQICVLTTGTTISNIRQTIGGIQRNIISIVSENIVFPLKMYFSSFSLKVTNSAGEGF
jgi:hypothetical protein